MSYYSSGLITQDGELLNGPVSLANGVLVCNADGSSVISSIDSILGFTPANDASVVHLAGTETITGKKTYSGAPRFLNDGTGVALYIQSGQAIRGEGGLFIDATTNPLKLRQNASTRLETTADGVLISNGSGLGTIQAATIKFGTDEDGRTEIKNVNDGTIGIYSIGTLVASGRNNGFMVYQHLKAGSANTYDAGTFATPFRTGYFGTSVVTPLVDSSSTLTMNGDTGVLLKYADATKFAIYGSRIDVNQDMRPGGSSGTKNLGQELYQWGEVATESIRNYDGALALVSDVTVGGSSPGSEKTLQLYGNLEIQQNAGQAGDLINVTDALASDLFALTSTGGLYGSHIQNLGTSDSPTFDALSVTSVIITDSSGFTSYGYDSGNESANQSSFGHYAGKGNTGSNQSAFGYYAGRSNTGDQQTVMGIYAGWDNSGDKQSTLGIQAGRQNTGNDQSAFGYYAGRENTGTYQSAFGSQAGYLNTGDNCVFIGYQAGYQNTTHNRFELKQNNVNNTPLIAGDFSSGAISIAGDLTATGFTAGDGTSSDSGGLQMATTGGVHGLSVVSNTQYLTSYNKTLIRNNTTTVFDSNGGQSIIANAVPSCPRGLHVKSLSAAYKAMVVRAAASQTANLTEWQDSAGNVTARVDADGRIFSTLRVGIGDWEWWSESGSSLRLRYHSGDEIRIEPNAGFVMEDAAYYAIGSSTNGGGDVRLHRDDAGIWASRNGTNPQVLRVYNTYDGVNDEFFSIDWQEASNQCRLTTNSGSLRNLKLRSANDLLFDTESNSDNIYFQTGGNYRIRMSQSQFYPYINEMRLGTTGSPWHGSSFRNGSSDPTTSDLDDGYGTTWKNTTTGEIRDWVNDGGVMKKSAAYVAA